MKLGLVALLLVVASACDAAAAGRVRVAVAGRLGAPVAERSWTVRLAVRPVSFRGTIRVTASGTSRLSVRASGRRGAYRARFVFPKAGRWSLVARAGTSTSRLGTVRVQPAPLEPVTFTEPTSIALEPNATALIVENNPGRVLRVDLRTGAVSSVVPSATRPYSIVWSRATGTFFSDGTGLRRIDTTGTLTTVVDAADLGPVTTAPNGDVYYTNGTRIFRLAGGAGSPIHVAGNGVAGSGGDGGPAVNAQFAAPHGLAIAADGALLVADTGNDRIRRIDPASGVITSFASVGAPDGVDVAADGTIYVVDSHERRVAHLSASGAQLGFVGPAFGLPYDLDVADDGAVYVLEAGPVGYVRRIAPDGTVTTVSRRS